MNLSRRRLAVLGISDPRFKRPVDVVKSLLAVQAQDYLGALWAVGLRMPSATERDIERALGNRSIVRTWPMRGTLHFLAAADARWITELCAPRVLARHAKRLKSEYGLEARELATARKVVEKALAEGPVTREAVYESLDSAGIETGDGRGLHIVWHLAQQGVICFGPRHGKQQTFVLLDEWLPGAKRLTREESLAELAERYFAGHGPATLADFTWWTGLAASEAREALESARSRLNAETIDAVEYFSGDPATSDQPPATSLLPAFDEYLVGYRGRGIGLGTTLLVRGGVAGSWKRTLMPGQVVVRLMPDARLSKPDAKLVGRAVKRFGNFLEGPAVPLITKGKRTTLP